MSSARVGLSVSIVLLLSAALQGCGGARIGSHTVAPPATSSKLEKPLSVSPGSIKAAPMRAPASARMGSAGRQKLSAIQPLNWTQLPGALTLVAASPDGTLWGLGTGSGDRPIYHYVGGTWTYVQGAASRLAVGPNGTPWAVTAAGGIYSYQSGSWTALAGGATDITAGADGSIYVISNQNPTSSGYGVWQYAAGSWTQLAGAGVRISASLDTGTHGGNPPGGFYLVTSSGTIFYYAPSTGYRQQLGTASEIAPTTNGGYFTLAYPADPANSAITYTDLDANTATVQSGAGVSISTNTSYAYVVNSSHQAFQTSAIPGTVVWQTSGSGNLGGYQVVDGWGDCRKGQSPQGNDPVISGGTIWFTVYRNTNATYTYNGTTYNGASTCYRNQMDPIDPNTGSNFLLQLGSHYTFTFQTVVNFNGNYLFQNAADGGQAADVPAILWQTHTNGEHGGDGPCDLLVIQNTYREWSQGITKYGNPVAQGGQPVWNFHTCDETDFTGNAYNSSDTISEGEVDNWQIDITAQIQGQSGGSVIVRRNGAVVYNAPSHVCDGTWPECWWNFGPYMIYWPNSEEPPGWNNAGVTVQMNNMTLYKQ